LRWQTWFPGGDEALAASHAGLDKFDGGNAR
jgi:hypothetical protein